MYRKKIGRNEQCFCGSNKKYKHCHGNLAGLIRSSEEQQLMIKKMEAMQQRAKDQQGLGKNIISIDFNNTKIVAVGDNVYYSKNWKTFPDFLFAYIINILGQDWFLSELGKPSEEKHQILIWYNFLQEHKKKSIKDGEITFVIPTGAINAYLHLAYDLYCIQHNVDLQNKLITRLKNKDQFPGAYYETTVFANLIRAGFEIEYEDESGMAGKRTECIATCAESGNKYTVEAKIIHSHETFGLKKNTASISKTLKASLGDQLRNAFKKQSAYPRIIFIELNMHNNKMDQEQALTNEILHVIKSKETELKTVGSAYLVITNNPSHRYLDEVNYNSTMMFLGFKIPEFGCASFHESLKAYYYSKKKHKDMYSLIKSMRTHRHVPSTFDGEVPEFSFGHKPENRLLIGNNYKIPDKNGGEILGILKNATVIEKDKICFCVYWAPEKQRSIIATCPLTESEFIAYKQHPKTFFGTIDNQCNNEPIHEITDLFDFFLEAYSKTPKELLLQFMQKDAEIEKLKCLDQEELAVIYCEFLARKTFEKFIPASGS